jgi:hypothetical protein
VNVSAGKTYVVDGRRILDLQDEFYEVKAKLARITGTLLGSLERFSDPNTQDNVASVVASAGVAVAMLDDLIARLGRRSVIRDLCGDWGEDGK